MLRNRLLHFPAETRISGKIFFSCIILLTLAYHATAESPQISLYRRTLYDAFPTVYLTLLEDCRTERSVLEDILYADLHVDGRLYGGGSQLLTSSRLLDVNIPEDANLSLRVISEIGGESNTINLSASRLFRRPRPGETSKIRFLFKRKMRDCALTTTLSPETTTTLRPESTTLSKPAPQVKTNYPIFLAVMIVVLLAVIVIYFKGRGAKP